MVHKEPLINHLTLLKSIYLGLMLPRLAIPLAFYCSSEVLPPITLGHIEVFKGAEFTQPHTNIFFYMKYIYICVYIHTYMRVATYAYITIYRHKYVTILIKEKETIILRMEAFLE